MLIVGRIINGLAVGVSIHNFSTSHSMLTLFQICSAQVPVYISELAPPSKRGRLVGAQQWAITWGIMIMFYICYGCSYIKGTAAFRVPSSVSSYSRNHLVGWLNIAAGKNRSKFSRWYTLMVMSRTSLSSASSRRSGMKLNSTTKMPMSRTRSF
jgi:Sugar (and other) transporter